MTGRPRVEIFPSAELLAARGAELFREAARQAISLRGRCSVALSGGSTPIPLYRHLATEMRRSPLDWQRMEIFWADERCVPPDHLDSNFRLVHEHLLSLIAGPGPVVHRIRGELTPQEAARAYEADLASSFPHAPYPAFDLVLLGVGVDGHTASLFPGFRRGEYAGRTAVPVYVEKLRSHRITLTPEAINGAGQVLFVVTGALKADIVAEILAGSGTAEFPAGLIHPPHGAITWLLDADAAGRLKRNHGEGTLALPSP